MIQYSEIAKAPLNKVWENFLYKIDYPENFVPGVSNVEVIEKSTDYVIRAMDITSPDGKTARILEKITYSPYLVKFLILDHPIYMGHVDNLAEALSDVETRITFSIHWVNKETGEPFKDQELAKNAVLKTIAFITDKL